MLDDADVDGCSDAAVDRRAPRLKPGPKLGKVQLVGPPHVVSIIVSTSRTALWQNVFQHVAADNPMEHENVFLGFAVVRWHLEPLSPSDDDAFYAVMRMKSRKGTFKRHTCVGYITWKIHEFITCDGYDVDTEPSEGNPVPLSWARNGSVMGYTCDAEGNMSDRGPVAAYFDSWCHQYSFGIDTLRSVFVAPSFGMNIVDSGLRTLHVIPLFRDRRLIRSRMLAGAPSNANLKKFIASVPVAPPGGEPDDVDKSSWNGFGIRKILAHLDASAELRDIGRMDIARKKFQELEARLEPSENHRDRKFGSNWNYESLRRARINLDATCSLLHRAYWLMFPIQLVFMNLYIDASPQWKGIELFAASWDFVVGDTANFYERRLLLQVSIGSPYEFHKIRSANVSEVAFVFVCYSIVFPFFIFDL